MKSLLKLIVISILALSFAAVGCEEKKEEKKEEKTEEKAEKEAKTDEAKEEKAEEAPKEEPKEEPKKELTLEEQDLTAKAKETWPAFEGKMSMMVPAGATLEAGLATLKITSGELKMEVCTAVPTIAESKAKWEKGEGFLKEVKLKVDEDTAVMGEGDSMGKKGHFVQAEFTKDGLTFTCRTGTGYVYDEATAQKVLEACKSLKVE